MALLHLDPSSFESLAAIGLCLALLLLLVGPYLHNNQRS
jgi:hypothetical protein